MASEDLFELPPMESYLPSDVARLLDSGGDVEPLPRLGQSLAASSTLQATAQPFTPALLQTRLPLVPHAASFMGPLAPMAGFAAPPPSLIGIPDPTADLLTTATVPSSEATQLCNELMKFVMPSGPRLNGQGIDEQNQGIENTLVISDRAMLIQMTLLVAGFIIGPSGESIRSVMAVSGCAIFSYTEMIEGKQCRVFFLEGAIPCIITATNIILEAVIRYKDLAEGKYMGLQVDKKQHIQGIDFYYQPPPRSLVPFAATLRVPKPVRNRRSLRN